MKRRLIARIKTARPNLFFTLTTSKRTAPTPEAAWHVASKAFALLIKRWRHRYPSRPLEYLIVWEKTKAGWPHIHALAEGPRPSKHWLSHTWNELTHSYIVDLQQIGDTPAAIAYISKYLTKDPQVPPGFRRWRRSAKFFKLPARKPTDHLPRLTDWRILHRSEQALICTFISRGLYAFRDEQGILRSRADHEKAAKQVRNHTLLNLLSTLSERDRETVSDWPFHPRDFNKLERLTGPNLPYHPISDHPSRHP